jgi:hypothetical protein
VALFSVGLGYVVLFERERVRSTRQAALIFIGGGTFYRNNLKEIGKYKAILQFYIKDPKKTVET